VDVESGGPQKAAFRYSLEIHKLHPPKKNRVQMPAPWLLDFCSQLAMFSTRQCLLLSADT
jgi:hypothetical protein